MAKRGGKSAAELSLVRVAFEGNRPLAPVCLTVQEAQTWLEILESTL